MILSPAKPRARRWRSSVLLLAAGLLTACEGQLGTPPTPLRQAQFEGGAIVVAGPEGYCIDPVTLERRAGQGFALLASCQILSGGEGAVVEPMMLTVTIGSAGAGRRLPSPEVMAAEAGQSEISGGGVRDGLSLVHLAAGGNRVLDAGDPRYWRGAFHQNGRLVILALYAPKGSALAGSDGAGMLQAVRSRIAALSPEATAQR